MFSITLHTIGDIYELTVQKDDGIEIAKTLGGSVDEVLAYAKAYMIASGLPDTKAEIKKPVSGTFNQPAGPENRKVVIVFLPGGTFDVRWFKSDGPALAEAGELNFDEMIGLVARLTINKPHGRPLYELTPEQQLRFGRVPPGHAAVVYPLEKANEITHGLSDFLCWADGFKAALPEDQSSRAPLGIETIRTVNLAFKSAIRKVEE